MPELPDITIYVERLAATVVGHALVGVRVPSPFVVRTFDPPVTALVGRVVRGVARLGKRLVLRFDDELSAVIHLMIAGRLRWKPPGAALPGKLGLAAFDFAHGTLSFTEASKQKRASLHVVRGAERVGQQREQLGRIARERHLGHRLSGHDELGVAGPQIKQRVGVALCEVAAARGTPMQQRRHRAVG